MRGFWDEKARENAMYYISSYRDYDDQDPEEFWRWGAILGERFLKESGIDFSGEESVLEIGCGMGRMTRYFATRFRNVTGLDVSEEMIRLGRAALGDLDNVTLDVGPGTDLSLYEAESFDLVFSYIVFQHIPDASITENYLREAGRVLKPGGNLYVQVNTMRPTLRERLGALKRRLLGPGRAADAAQAQAGPSGLEHPAWVGSRVSVARVRRVLDSAGLEPVAITGEGSQYTWVRAVKVR